MFSYIFWLSEQFAPSVPMPTLTPRRSMPRMSARPFPSRMLLPGFRATEQPWYWPAYDVVPIEPDAMGDSEIGAEQAEILQMGGLRLAVAFQPSNYLHLEYPDVAVVSPTPNSRERPAQPHMKVSLQ